MLDKFKELFKTKNHKKTVNHLILLLMVGALVLLLSNILLSDKNNSINFSQNYNEKNSENGFEKRFAEDDYGDTIEKKLEAILKKIEGAGEVHVMITYEETTEKVPAFNTTQMIEETEEKDAQGGTRKVVREDVSQQIATRSSGDSLIIKETNPQIKGVIVVAEGAKNIEVKEKLYTAVKTVLGITGNRVEVFFGK